MNDFTVNISDEVKTIISQKKIVEYNILPLKVEDGSLYIGIANKNNRRIINDLNFYTGRKIIPVEMPSEIILKKIKEIYFLDDEKKELAKETNNTESSNENYIMEGSNVEFVNQVITGAIKSGSSDIHFETFENSLRIRYRIDGQLREVFNLQKEKSMAVASRLKIMANLDISEKRRPQDGRIRFSYNDKMVDIRLSTLPTNYGEKIVLRILDKSQLQLDLTKLELNEEQLKILYKKLSIPYGMILVTGPTGSGKTTTLYASLRHIHSVEKNILTVEDPIEYNLDGINQSNVRPDLGYDFAGALRTFLRQDPDIIMVGEIRDRETAEIAIRASLTGHLVLSTLHTNDSISAVTRLIDMGIEPFLVASSVKLIIAQRLVRRLCSCKVPSQNKSMKEFLKTDVLYDKCGCEKCSYTGYKGRLAIFELLDVTDDFCELVTKNSGVKELRERADESGFISLRESGIEKIRSGLTTYEEVLRETML